MRNHSRFRSRALLAACALSLAACGGASEGAGVGEQSTVPEGSRGDETVREQCVGEGAAVSAVDVNNDGRPDIRHVRADGGGRRIKGY